MVVIMLRKQKDVGSIDVTYKRRSPLKVTGVLHLFSLKRRKEMWVLTVAGI